MAEVVQMSLKESDRYAVIVQVIERTMGQSDAGRLQCKVIDECVQLFGGYGYMWEYPITRAYADARVQRIYGGTNEIMKEVITRSMGLGK